MISNGVTSEYHEGSFPRKCPDKFVILNVGRNAAEKWQDLLLCAVAQSRYRDDIKIILIGNWHQRADLVRLSEDLLNAFAKQLLLLS